MNTSEAKRVLEAALICAASPMPVPAMRALFDGEVGTDTLRSLLDELAHDWQDRGVELVALASGWRFQSRPEMREFLDRLHPEKPPKYSRAAMETLAIVAYRQPVTRGDIEDIRGVTVSGQIVKQLEDRGWIEAIGYREAAGRPALYATTRQFLDDLGLASLDQLPAIDAQLDGQLDGAHAAQALAAMAAAQPSLHEAQGTLPLETGPTEDAPMDAPLDASEDALAQGHPGRTEPDLDGAGRSAPQDLPAQAGGGSAVATATDSLPEVPHTDAASVPQAKHSPTDASA